MQSDENPRNGDWFEQALAYLLRPLVALMVHRGILLTSAVALLKRVFVDVVERELERQNENVTDSRISVLTGVHRRDVRSIRSSGRPSGASPPVPLAAMLLARWRGDPQFCDKDGKPVSLSRTAQKGALSFGDLAQGVVKDVRPRTLLDEMLARGLITEEEKGWLRPTADVLVPADDDPALMDYFRANLHDHIAAAVCNVREKKPVFFERSVAYSGVSPDLVTDLQRQASLEGQALLERINNKTLATKEGEEDGRPEERYRLGIYFYREPDEA